MCDSKWEAILNSRILGNYFRELCRNFLPPYRESSTRLNRQKAELNGNLIFVLEQTKRLVIEGKVDEETFKNQIKNIKDLNDVHVEILWYVEVSQILTLKEFLQFHESNNNEDVVQHIAGQFFENMLELRTNPSEIRRKLLLFCLGTLLECSKHNTGNKNSFFQAQINLIVGNLKQVYAENCDIERHLDVAQLTEFLNNFDIDLIKKLIKQILIGVLEGVPQTLKSVLKKQESIKNHVKVKKIYQFFMIISKYCDLGFLTEQLEAILLKSVGIDWDFMFCFITFIGVQYKEGWSSLKVLVGLIIKLAFQDLDGRLLLHGFLIARQGCFERGNSSFPSYVQWFGSTFSTESRRPVNSKKMCHFFFSFLTEILPHDLTYYSKVHINKPPWVPADCQTILNDFVENVRTHLSDLNVSAELGICENTTDKSAAEFDVESVLKHFERTNEILLSVFQAAMFCKDYYVKKFLAELLSKFEGRKSVRHKFILKLHSLGKVPNSLFKTYKSLEKNK